MHRITHFIFWGSYEYIHAYLSHTHTDTMAPSALDKPFLYISKQYATLDFHPHIPQPSYRIVLIALVYILIRPYFMIPKTRRDRFAWFTKSWARITLDVKKRLEEGKTLAETKKEREDNKGERAWKNYLKRLWGSW
jgi:hypothetical protein